MQGTQIAFEFQWSFQKMRANLSPFLKRALICPWTFSKAAREPISFFKKEYRAHFNFLKMREKTNISIIQWEERSSKAARAFGQ